MRWQPDSPVCAECGFDWDIARDSAIDLVAQAPDAAAAASVFTQEPTQRAGERWSASMYLWHLVDVLRIGTERPPPLPRPEALSRTEGPWHVVCARRPTLAAPWLVSV